VVVSNLANYHAFIFLKQKNMRIIYVIFGIAAILSSCSQTQQQNTNTAQTLPQKQATKTGEKYLLYKKYDNRGRDGKYKLLEEYITDTLGNKFYTNGQIKQYCFTYVNVDTFEIREGKKYKAIYRYRTENKNNPSSKELFDAKGNLIEEQDRLLDNAMSQGKNVYKYNDKNQCIRKIGYQNNELKYEFENRYKDDLLVEKYTIFTQCCDNHQPIPIDRVLYFYDNKGQKIQECEIVDAKIKRNYKKNMAAENYTYVDCTKYTYDSLGRVIKSCGMRLDDNAIVPLQLITRFADANCDSFVYKTIDKLPTN
jgi:hypothetical protein